MAEGAELEDLAKRFLDLWQDQMSALAGDPEYTEALNRLLAAMGVAGAQAPEDGQGWPDALAGLMRAAGAHITSTEAVIFDWLKKAGGDDFKALSKMIR